MIGRFVGASVALFGIAAYGTYKVNEAKQFKELYFDTLPDKRQYLLQQHQNAAYVYDSTFDSYEQTSKIQSYRKTIVGLCSGKILETGVGTSRNIKHYPQGSDVTAVDWSSNVLEVALLKSTSNINISYRLEDVENMSFKDNTFDTVLDTFGLEYYLNPDKAISEMKRVCKPGKMNLYIQGGKILLLTSGRSSYDILNLYLEYKQAKYLKNLGQFCNRDWESIVQDPELLVLTKERKINGTVYFYVLENNKKQ